MAKSKAKKTKAINSKTPRGRVGRPLIVNSVTETKADRKSIGAPHHNGNGASAPAPSKSPAGPKSSETAPEHRLEAGSMKTKSGVDLTEKIRELLILAKEQGHLTYDDINDALPDNIVTPDDLDQVYTKLANLEIDIVDQAEVDRVKQPEAEEEEEKEK